MIKKLLWPMVKRFKGLFISMCFVGMLALGLLMAFTNVYINLQQTYPHYFNEYGAPTVTVQTGFTNYGDYLTDINKMDGVDIAEARISLDCYLKRPDGRKITTRVHTTRATSKINKLYTVKEIDIPDNQLWVSVEGTFAKNNNFQLGDTIGLGAFGIYIPAKIKNFVEAPETIYVRVKEYIWSDNNDFGFVYLNTDQAKSFVSALAVAIDNKGKEDPDFKDKVDTIIGLANIFFPDYKSLLDQENVDKFVEESGNEILVKSKGIDNQTLADSIKTYLEGKGVEVKDSKAREKTTSYVYMNKAANQIKIAAIFLPVFFYGITMFVIILFINQMVKSMTSDIGIMMSVGIRGREISGVFSLFIFIVSVVSSLLGFGLSQILLHLLQNTMLRIYHIPYMVGGINIWLLLGGVASLVIIGQLATLIASNSIYKITPKDAMISNESKRKPLPKFLENIVDKSPATIKLGVNSVAQNLRRFSVSVFSIFAALTMTIVTMTFVDAKNELLDQTLNRRLCFDCQVYMTGIAEDEYVNNVKSQKFVTSLANGYFTYLEISNGDNKLMLQTVALDDNTPKELIYIPDETGRKDMEVTGNGIILDKGSAESLKVKVGDMVSVNDHKLRVDAISYQYFNMTQYVKKETLEGLGSQYASTFFINTNNEQALLDYLAEEGTNSLTVFSRALKTDMSSRLNTVNLFAYILVAFSIGMGLVILSIMTQNTLLEQQRTLSILRAVGFRTIEISNMWMVQSSLQLLFSNLFAIPTGLFVGQLLFRVASSATQVYPFVVNPWSLAMCLGFIFVVIGICHLIAMFTISKWNLADNTRSRE